MSTADFTTLDWIIFSTPAVIVVIGLIVGFISEMWGDS
jgi:uncharacterized membrane protein required for colicin V production